MLDRADARAQRPRDGLRRVRVRGDVAVRGARLVDSGLEFGDRELRGVDPVGRRRDPASRHDLDVMGAAAQFVARRLAHLVGPVDDGGQFAARGMGVEEILAGPAVIAVAAGLAQCAPGVEQPRPSDQALLQRPPGAVVAARHVADGREPAVEHLAEQSRRAVRVVGDRPPGQFGHVSGAGHDVDVRVDQARQHERPAEVDPARPGRNAEPIPGFAHDAVVDAQVALPVRRGLDIEEQAVRE